MNILKFNEELMKLHKLSLEIARLQKTIWKHKGFDAPVKTLKELVPGNAIYGKFSDTVLTVVSNIFANYDTRSQCLEDYFQFAESAKTMIEYINDHWQELSIDDIKQHYTELNTVYQHHLLRKITDAFTPSEMSDMGIVETIFELRKANEAGMISDHQKGYFMAYKRAAGEEDGKGNLYAMRYLLANVPKEKLEGSAHDLDKMFLYSSISDLDEISGLIDALPEQGFKKQGSRRIPFYPHQLAIAALMKNKTMEPDMRKKIKLIYS